MPAPRDSAPMPLLPSLPDLVALATPLMPATPISAVETQQQQQQQQQHHEFAVPLPPKNKKKKKGPTLLPSGAKAPRCDVKRRVAALLPGGSLLEGVWTVTRPIIEGGVSLPLAYRFIGNGTRVDEPTGTEVPNDPTVMFAASFFAPFVSVMSGNVVTQAKAKYPEYLQQLGTKWNTAPNIYELHEAGAMLWVDHVGERKAPGVRRWMLENFPHFAKYAGGVVVSRRGKSKKQSRVVGTAASTADRTADCATAVASLLVQMHGASEGAKQSALEAAVDDELIAFGNVGDFNDEDDDEDDEEEHDVKPTRGTKRARVA